MIGPSAPYEKLLALYLDGKLSTEAFRDQYEDTFSNDDTMFETKLYEILNELFADAVSLTSDPKLLAKGPAFYLDDKQFREKAELASARLADWRSDRSASG